MTRSREVRTNITADEKDLLRGLASAKRALRDYEQQVERSGLTAKQSSTATAGLTSETGGLASSFGMLATKVGVAAAATEGARRVVMGLAGAASDLSESQNKVSVVFGESSRTISAFSQNSAQALGLSQRAALDAAGAYGNMFKTIGLGDDVSAQMSTRLVQLAADMASFNNQDPSEMLMKLRSGLAGEAEPLRTVGVLLSEARVKQEAYASGIATVGAELTEAQKVQARYSLILKDTAVQQGDFARTSDGLANKQRQLAAEFENMKAKIGAGLTGPLAEAAGAANGLLGSIGRLAELSSKPIAFTVQMIFDPGQWIQEKVGLPTGRDAQGRSWLGRTARDLEKWWNESGTTIGSQWSFAPSDIPLTKGSMWDDSNFMPGGSTPPVPDLFMTQRDAEFKRMMEGSADRVAAMMREANGGPSTAVGGGGGGAAAARMGLSAGGLARVGGIMGGLPGLSSSASVAEFDAAVQRFKDVKQGLNRDLAEIGLAMADLSARGLEQTDTFRDLEGQADALNDAMKRVGLEETIRIDSIRDSIEVARAAAAAEKELGERRKQEAANILQQLWRNNPNQSAASAASMIAIANTVGAVGPGGATAAQLDSINQAVAAANATTLARNPEIPKSEGGAGPERVVVSLSSDLRIAGEP